MTLRIAKGVPDLLKYLEDNGVELSLSTIYRLIRKQEIPFKRINTQTLLFDLNKIDRWIVGDDE
ncbi:hypothetical protein PB01_08075 [Psychrobacillus glaciei]|uniref:DNA-binding protein n=1 Tax=Psychrobacillus glaciei TaxID=2283160 RepID=A0A5J6SM50_9BACI|nr:hypothetical protein [Psychrobacillus glaciei]QFF98792.1 hypothetical protein PB01_08075 [Psychrobacillus glaciei]